MPSRTSDSQAMQVDEQFLKRSRAMLAAHLLLQLLRRLSVIERLASHGGERARWRGIERWRRALARGGRRGLRRRRARPAGSRGEGGTIAAGTVSWPKGRCRLQNRAMATSRASAMTDSRHTLAALSRIPRARVR